jgi:Fe-S cluster biogenesis protein NfuA
MAGSEDPDLRAVGARIEQLLEELRAVADPAVQRRVEEAVRLLVELYGAGLARAVALLQQERDGPRLIGRLAADDLVASLLVLHGLHPLELEARVRGALERVRPWLGAHAGGVELLGVDDDGVVRLRLEGSCHGCPSSTATVRLAIERAIEEAAPDVTRVEVEGLVEPRRAGESQLLQIQPLYSECPAEVRQEARA